MKNRPEQLKSSFLGAMLATALGDAIGELAFGLQKYHGLQIHEQKEILFEKVDKLDVLKYTDDTAMALGLAESLCEHGKIDVTRLGDNFRRNYEREPWRGYASGPPTIFSLVKRGRTYEEAAASMFGGTGSFGNGAAMRITPLGLFFHDSDDINPEARKSAVVTHAHPLGIDGAAILAKAVAMAVSLDVKKRFARRDFCAELRQVARTEEFREQLTLVPELLLNEVPPQEAIALLGRGVASQESVSFAIFAFLASPGSFEECLSNAVLHGGDRDTLGAMACAISGAYLGVEAIPGKWLAKIENRDYIEKLTLKLLSKHLQSQ